MYLFQKISLIHWGWVTHICLGELTIIGSDNGLSSGWHQAIIWTSAGILLVGPLETNLSEIWIEIQTFLFKKMHLKMSKKIAAILSGPQCFNTKGCRFGNLKAVYYQIALLEMYDSLPYLLNNFMVVASSKLLFSHYSVLCTSACYFISDIVICNCIRLFTLVNFVKCTVFESAQLMRIWSLWQKFIGCDNILLQNKVFHFDTISHFTQCISRAVVSWCMS